MKKIGIVTFHRADNLGAVLQAYALQTVLCDRFGVDAKIIDYRCPHIESDRRKSSGLKGLALQAYYYVKHRGFERFRRRWLKMSPSYTSDTVSNCTEDFDAFITGSDQVWNYECSGWDNRYFLDFVPENKQKYSYAASLGQYQFSDQERSLVQTLLSGYDGVSVREESAGKLIEPLYPGTVHLCADPVLLLPKEEWLSIMSPRPYVGKYVFVYTIVDSDDVIQCAQEYGRKHGYKVIFNKKSPEFILKGSPADFLSWIYHAECVFTNSFHGTAFSLLLERPLVAQTVCADNVVNKRVLEMLQRANATCCDLGSFQDTVCRGDSAQALREICEASYQYLDRICND